MELIHRILQDAIDKKASDIHILANFYPILRVDGELIKLTDYGIMEASTLAEMIPVFINKQQMQEYEKKMQVDSSYEFRDNRFRVHIYRQKGSDAFALRLIPKRIPKISELNLPQVIYKFTTLRNGLVLITGTTGSGKSTTLAAIIGEINETQSKHIITVEDPIEFVHEHKKSIINQREVGSDVVSFSEAVKGAMREDPDILLLGEMRDLETIMNAITMAETGHLVFATLHTRSVAETVDRIIDVFPPNQQEQVRIQLANCLQGVVSQTLLPKVGGGRVPCCEVMIVTDAIRSLIREHGTANAINDQIQMNNKKLGSQTFHQGLADLYKKKLISKETVFANCATSEEVELMKRLIMS